MSQPWVILTRRYGADIRSPSPDQLANAIAELYHETLPDMTEDDYAEHGAAFLRYGYDEGPMFVIEVDRLRQVTFEELADQDYERELMPPRHMHHVSEDQALQLWMYLAHGQIESVRSQRWQ
jgi:hypothetical protein